LTLRAIIAIWCCFEIGLAVHDRIARREAVVRDTGSKALILIAIALGLYLAFRVRGSSLALTPEREVWWSYLAGVFMLLGLATRIHAVIMLRRYFTTTVTLRSEQPLVRSGLYRLIRHPGYLGSLLLFGGLGISMRSWLSVLILMVFVVPAFHYRIRIEEHAMHERFGVEYTKYRRATKRLVPWIY